MVQRGGLVAAAAGRTPRDRRPVAAADLLGRDRGGGRRRVRRGGQPGQAGIAGARRARAGRGQRGAGLDGRARESDQRRVGRPARGRRGRLDRARAAALRALVVGHAARRPGADRAYARGMQPPSPASRALVATAAALALADASIVALALPPILAEMHTTVTGVAAIVGVYAFVLAAAILPAERLVRRYGPSPAGAGGLLVFAAASVGCAVAGSLGPLLVFRAIQAAGAAAGLIAAFDILDAGSSSHGRRLWLGAALAGTAAGPAIGGALTEAFDWRAIFALQAPVCAAAAIGCWRARMGAEPAVTSHDAFGPLWARGDAAPPGESVAATAAPARFASPTGAALAFTSAAFTAVLFLLVLELVAGFALSPLSAAAGVTVLPIAALIASTVRGSAVARAGAGAVLLAGGAVSLAFLPAPEIGWAVVPQVLAGAGMGLALPAYAGELLAGRPPGRRRRRGGSAAARGRRRAAAGAHVARRGVRAAGPPRRHRADPGDPRAGRLEPARRPDRPGRAQGRVAGARREPPAGGQARARPRPVQRRQRGAPARRPPAGARQARRRAPGRSRARRPARRPRRRVRPGRVRDRVRDRRRARAARRGPARP